MSTYIIPIKKPVPRLGWNIGDQITIEPGVSIRSGQIALLANGDYWRLTNDALLPAEPVALVTAWQRGIIRRSNYHWF